MTATQLEEALELTVGGIGIAIAVMVLLIGVVVALKWVFETRFVQRRTGVLAAVEAASARRRRALAAAVAVRVALAMGEATSYQDAQEDASA